jgi:MoxR-like ATPase
MEERQVSVDGVTRALSPSFFVLASQNPVEQHGTFPLPEAQLDRFLVRIRLGYTKAEEEVRILQSQARAHPIDAVQPVVSAEEFQALQAAVREVHVHPALQGYLVAVVQATRSHEDVLLGASPRGSLALMRCAQALALLEGRTYITPQMIKTVVHPVLDHRVILTPQARLAGTSAAGVIDEILDAVEVPTLDAEVTGAAAGA